MHFDQRTQAARRSVGLSTAGVRAASAGVVELGLGPTVHDRVRFAATRQHR
jgi:hypothetical protein